jgi:hypothetical protein
MAQRWADLMDGVNYEKTERERERVRDDVIGDIR